MSEHDRPANEVMQTISMQDRETAIEALAEDMAEERNCAPRDAWWAATRAVDIVISALRAQKPADCHSSVEP